MNARERLERIERELREIRTVLGRMEGLAHLKWDRMSELYRLVNGADRDVADALLRYGAELEKVEVPGE